MIPRRQFVAGLLRDRGNLLVVSGLGSPTYDVAQAGDHPGNFYLWGAMGGAIMVGLGLALAVPGQRVAVLTGDGEALMGLGSLATVGCKQPPNLCIVVIDNEHYGETGMQPSHTRSGVDLVQIAKGCKFLEAARFDSLDQADDARHCLYHAKGPVFLHVKVDAEEGARLATGREGALTKARFRQFVDDLRNADTDR